MFFARIVPGESPQVYPIDGHMFPRAWGFVAFKRGACAVDVTAVLAVRSARAQLRRMELQRIMSGEHVAQRPEVMA